MTAVIGLNAFGKVIGFVREALVSAMFGVTRATDVYFATQQGVLFPYNFVGGAFNLAFVPEMAAADREGQGDRLIGAMRRRLTALALVATPLVAGFVLAATAADIRSVFIVIIMALSIWSLMMNGLAVGVFYARQRPIRATVQSAMVNWGMVGLLAALAVMGAESEILLALSFSGGAAVGLMGARAAIGGWRGPAEQSWRISMRLKSNLAAASIENVAFNLNQLANVAWAGREGAGWVTINVLALRLATMPIAALVTPVAQVLQTRILGRDDRSRPRTLEVVGPVVLWGALATLLAVLSPAIVGFVYRRGAFSVEDAHRVTMLMRPYAAYFFVMAVNQTLARFLFVRGEGTVFGGALTAAYVVSNVIKFAAAPLWGLQGVIWACASSEGVATGYLFYRIQRRGGGTP